MFRKLFLGKYRNVGTIYKTLNVKYSQEAVASAGHNEYSLESSQIEEAVKLKPTLASVSPELWRRSHKTFLNHGLKTINFLQIAVGNPKVLTQPPSKIIDSFEYWRSCQFGEKLLHLLLTKYPQLLNVDDGHRLLKHISFLKSFVGTNKNVWKLLMNSPDVMEQTEKRLEEKFTYITERMRIDIPEIVKSAALSKTLDEIRCRHIFQERLGLFKPRPLKADPNEPSKNNRLYQITDTSDKTFSTKICHVRLVEFETFQELFKKEQNKRRNNNDDEDIDSDDD